MKPILFRSPLLHRNYVQARHRYTELVRSSPGGKVIALVGPTQTGKSLIFEHVVRMLESELSPVQPGTMPLVHLVIATSNDGRMLPKPLTLRLLKVIRHPLYEHYGELDEANHYRPSRGRDEGSMRVALEVGLDARQTLYVLLDEAHHLTHTKSRELRSNILQSIKCLCAIDRTLGLAGGYELAYGGLFDSAHFAGRLVPVELAPYLHTKSDLEEWYRILKFCSKHIDASPPSLLVQSAQELLEATNGCFGLLEKMLWIARSTSDGGRITRSSLLSAFPSEAEHQAIRLDIQAGRLALTELKLNSQQDSPKSAAKTEKSERPFKRKPNRVVKPLPRVANE